MDENKCRRKGERSTYLITAMFTGAEAVAWYTVDMAGLDDDLQI